MCGIAGLWTFDGMDADASRTLATAMARRLRHRGPDDERVWTDPHAGIALSFRRLSILDLSSAGAQPMTSASGRYVLAFNGEIYNFERLRRRLETENVAPRWRGHSDTEVLVACVDAWGLERTVEQANGMFAIALWDSLEKRLSLARDRAGEKPLYYTATRRSVAFASELKALEVLPDFAKRIDPDAAALYARFGYVPAPFSIYAGVRKVRPGAILHFTEDGAVRDSLYWDADAIASRCANDRFQGFESQAVEELDRLLGDAVALRMSSDVPLGVFLSGGVDSSLVTALMREYGSRTVSTFTIGFEDSRFDEAPYGADVARHLGTDHHELYVSASDALRLVPDVVAAYDEPFADSSAIPTYLVSHTARRAVTVALGGDGGDELFAGYHRHFLGRRLQRRVAAVPRTLRPAASLLLKLAVRSERAKHLSRALATSDPVATYYEGVTMTRSRTPELDRRPPASLTDHTEAVMLLDFATYLPDDILVKVDRASMAVSLETRAPFLDPGVIEFAWRLPIGMKVRDDQGKWILKQLLRRYLPDHLIFREKQGFGVPLAEWLRGPLRPWAEDLVPAMAPGQLERWNRHLAGENHASTLWAALMFTAWRRRTGAYE